MLIHILWVSQFVHITTTKGHVIHKQLLHYSIYSPSHIVLLVLGFRWPSGFGVCVKYVTKGHVLHKQLLVIHYSIGSRILSYTLGINIEVSCNMVINAMTIEQTAHAYK